MARNPAFDERRVADDLGALHDALAERGPVEREPSSLQGHLTRPGRRGADWNYPVDRLPGADR